MLSGKLLDSLTDQPYQAPAHRAGKSAGWRLVFSLFVISVFSVAQVVNFFLSLLTSFHNLVVHGRSVIWFSPLHSLSHFCRQK